MSDWWIDEVRYPGPVEEVARGIITYFSEVWQSEYYGDAIYYTFEGARGDNINKWLPQDEVWALFKSEFVYVGRLQSIQTKVAHHTMGATPQYDFTIETKLTRKEQEAQWSQSLSPQQPSASLKPV